MPSLLCFCLHALLSQGTLCYSMLFSAILLPLIPRYSLKTFATSCVLLSMSQTLLWYRRVASFPFSSVASSSLLRNFQWLFLSYMREIPKSWPWPGVYSATSLTLFHIVCHSTQLHTLASLIFLRVLLIYFHFRGFVLPFCLECFLSDFI